MKEIVLKFPGSFDVRPGLRSRINDVEYVVISVSRREGGTTLILRELGDWLATTTAVNPWVEFKCGDQIRIRPTPGDTVAEFLESIRRVLIGK